MVEPDRCELHEVAVFANEGEAGDLLRLAQSPIGDECQICPVCRAAREYVERLVAERSGYAPPVGESADASWQKLRRAIEGARTSIRPPG